MYDYLIIGAGPAGVQLGYFLERNNRNYLILEAGHRPGTYFERFPRHGMLLTVNKLYTGYDDPERQLRYDWNSLLSDDIDMRFRHYSAEFLPDKQDFVRYLGDFVKRFGLNIQYETRVARISKRDGFIVLDEQRNEYRCKRLVVATGVSKPYVPDIPGIEHAENYVDFSVDAKDYTDQRVLILGKGNSAFETASHLIPTARTIQVIGPKCITMAWSSHYKGDVRAVNSALIDTYHLKNQNHIHNANLTKIERRNGELIGHIAYTRAKGQTMEMAYDRILICTGFRMDTSIFDESCQPEMVPELRNKLPAMTSGWESVNVNDLYFIGVLMGAKDERKYFSSFISGYRYNIRILHKLLEEKYHDVNLPCKALPLDTEKMIDVIMERVSQASGLLLQQGFICDVMVVKNEVAHYYEELNVQYVHDSELAQNNHYYMITLEYGDFPDDAALCVDRDPDPDEAHEAVYLHPVIRRYDRTMLLAEHHIPETQENDWTIFQFIRRVNNQTQDDLRQMYRDRLKSFLNESMRMQA